MKTDSAVRMELSILDKLEFDAACNAELADALEVVIGYGPNVIEGYAGAFRILTERLRTHKDDLAALRDDLAALRKGN